MGKGGRERERERKEGEGEIDFLYERVAPVNVDPGPKLTPNLVQPEPCAG